MELTVPFSRGNVSKYYLNKIKNYLTSKFQYIYLFIYFISKNHTRVRYAQESRKGERKII